MKDNGSLDIDEVQVILQQLNDEVGLKLNLSVTPKFNSGNELATNVNGSFRMEEESKGSGFLQNKQDEEEEERNLLYLSINTYLVTLLKKRNACRL